MTFRLSLGLYRLDRGESLRLATDSEVELDKL